MSKLEKITFPLIFTLVVIAYAMSWGMSNRAFSLHWVIREDGLLECLTAFALLAGAVLCWWRCWALRDSHPKLFRYCTAVYGCVLFFGMGEEISWGQRMLGFETPEAWAEINGQAETNLHNLVIGGVSINKLVFGKLLAVGLAFYLIVLPTMHVTSVPMRRLLDRFAVPVPRLHHTLAVLAVVILVETSQASKRGEINEFAISSLVLLLHLNPHNLMVFRKASEKAKPESEEQPLRVAA